MSRAVQGVVQNLHDAMSGIFEDVEICLGATPEPRSEDPLTNEHDSVNDESQFLSRAADETKHKECPGKSSQVHGLLSAQPSPAQSECHECLQDETN